VGIFLVLYLLFWAIKNDCPTLILYSLNLFPCGPTIPGWLFIFFLLALIGNQECLPYNFAKLAGLPHYDFIFFESFSLWANHSCLASNFCSF
jgi:hypothetical protein